MKDIIMYIADDKEPKTDSGIYCIDGSEDIVEILTNIIIDKIKEC